MRWLNSKNFFPKLVVAFFVVAGLVLLLTDEARWPEYYDLPYMGWAALVCALAIFLIPQQFKFPLALILLFNASGDLGLYELYKYGFEYDKVIHFISPLIATLALARAFGLRQAITIVVLCAIGWELFEFLADKFIKTHLFGVYRHQIFRDTLTDLAMNMLGVTLASLWFRHRNRDMVIEEMRG